MNYLFILLMMFSLSACEKDGPSDSVAISEAQAATPAAADTPDLPEQELTITAEFMQLVNDHRISIGLDPLINHVGLSEIAQGHSDEMAKSLVPFGHLGFSSRCTEGRNVLGGGNMCGENVASGQKSAQAVFKAWMNSSGHRANIENGRYTHSGFGFAAKSNGTIYWTHLFLEAN